MKAWAKSAPSKIWPCIPEDAVILLVDAVSRRCWTHVAFYIMKAYVFLPRVSAAARMIAPDLDLTEDPRFIGMVSDCFLVFGHDKRQETSRI